MNFRSERQHDEHFMTLTRALNHIGRLDIFEQGLGLPILGALKSVRRRQAFDVEASFDDRRLLIETKVDSDEGGRWSAVDDSSQWQTSKIHLLAEDYDICLFITYGFAEFFTKWLDFGPAASAAGVRHVTLDIVVKLLESALPLLATPELDGWLAALRAEQRKRRAAPELLATFGDFRRRYLKICGDVDFTITRIGFNAPEIAFPVFARLLTQWRASSFCQRYGRLALYPASRRMLPADSILNWWELWQSGAPMTLGGLLPVEARDLYFEVNEDFNLHLKLRAETERPVEQVRTEISRRMSTATWPQVLIKGRPEVHFQGAYAVWEWDLDLPARLFEDEGVAAVNALGALLDEVVPRLA